MIRISTILMMCAGLVVAQAPAPPRSSYNTDGITPPTIAPGTPAGSYSLSGFDNVNLYNRKGNISIPITDVRTRGGAGYTMRLNLDQAWRVRIYADCSSGGGCTYFHTPLPDWWAGQEVEYGPGMVAGRFMDKLINCVGGASSENILTRLSFIDSNGSEQSLVDTTTLGRAVRVRSFESGNCTAPLSPPLRGPRFESTDGQAMTFVASAGIAEAGRTNPGDIDSRPTLFPSGTLYLADGSRYIAVQGKVTKIQDRNGNTVNIADVNSGGEVGLDITEANRNIQVRKLDTCDLPDASAGTRCDKISLGTQAGDPVVRIYWNNLSATGVVAETNKALFMTSGLNIDPVPPAVLFNPMVATKMRLPNGRSYIFQYDKFGDVTQVTLPTGGYYKYFRSTYGWGTDAPGILRQVDAREEYDSQGRFRRRTEYSFDGTGSNFGTLVKDFSNFSRTDYAIGSKRLVKASRTVFPTSFINPPSGASFYNDWQDGKEIRTDELSLALFSGAYNPDTIPNSSILKRATRSWALREAIPPSTIIGSFAYQSGSPFNPRETNRSESINGLSKTSSIAMGYDAFNNVISESIVNFDATTIQMKSRIYENLASYVNEPAHLRRLLKQENIGAGAASESETRYEYDDYSSTSGLGHNLNLAGAGAATQYEDRLLTQRGNVARVGQWFAQGSRWLVSESKYDVLGNIVQTWQPKDASESFERSSTFQFTPACNYSYPATITDALGRNSSFVYNCRTGQMTSFTDVNSKVTTMAYSDPLDRITSVVSPEGLGSTSYSYVDSPGSLKLTVTKTQNSCGANNIVTETFFDGFGRVIAEKRNDDVGSIEKRREYDGLGRAYWQGDPFRGSTEGNGTETEWDGLGRPVLVRTTADGSTTRMGYQLDESWSRDAQGKWKITKMDALGRMVSVVEDPVVASGAGPIAGFSNTGTSPTLETSYLHDGRGNLTKVTQGVQVRDFVYDSVGRLSSASNPEMGSGASGQVLYGYFDSGSLKQKTEPGSVVTTLSYDRLNRLEAKSYSGAAVVTNSVSFCYDGNTAGNCAGAPTGANLLGRATMVVSGVYRTKMLAYDALGRVTQSAQKFAADPDLVFGYQYTQAGGVSEIQYPSGKRVASCFDGSGQAKEVKNGATNAAWVSGLQYEVNGAVKQATLGNGVIETRDYNSRWQARTVKAMQGATNLLELQYRYCPLEADACNTNNGNVISQRVVHSGLNALMGYEYDSLNRLKRAVDAANSFEQVFDYDRWGNRALTSGYRPYSGMTVAALAAYNAGKNQLNAQVELPPLGAYTAFQYDLRGNQLTQVGGRAYTFDAENRMVEAKTQGVTQGQYRYDGEGRRVEVIAGGKTTRFVYDAFGGLAAEYEVGVGSGAMETTYLVGDALGSTRLAMRPDGSLRRYEYAPFGEEIESGSFGRGAEYGESVGKPRVSQRFTSKERDAETGLDFFEARYMSAAQGRFTSPDEPLLDQTSADPQSWNLYSYVRNNPLIFTDPTGNDCVYTNSGGKGVGSVDNQIAAPQCGTSGGYWVDGTVTNARFAHGSLVLTGTIEGTNKTSASYGLGPDPGILALQKGTQLAEPGVKLAAIGLALGIGGPAAGAAYGAVAGGTALTQLAIYTLPVVTSAIDKLQKLGISIYEAGQIVGSPTAQRLIDTANGGNINVVQQVGEKLVRITTDPSGQRIISAGIIQARNINNSIASGRFIVK